MAEGRDTGTVERTVDYLDRAYGIGGICRESAAEIMDMLSVPEQREAVLAERAAILDRYVLKFDVWQEDVRGLLAIAAFLRAPSRQTLRAALAYSSLAYADEGHRLISEQLADFEQRTAARVANLPKPSALDLATFIVQHEKQILLAMMHVEFGHGVTAIARVNGKSRSSVYAAIRFFLELPEEMQVAIRNRLTTEQ